MSKQEHVILSIACEGVFYVIVLSLLLLFGYLDFFDVKLLLFSFVVSSLAAIIPDIDLLINTQKLIRFYESKNYENQKNVFLMIYKFYKQRIFEAIMLLLFFPFTVISIMLCLFNNKQFLHRTPCTHNFKQYSKYYLVTLLLDMILYSYMYHFVFAGYFAQVFLLLYLSAVCGFLSHFLGDYLL